MKNSKGITLIALVITIIVMLILVGVTIATVTNGGLFTTAKDATNKQKLAEAEEMFSVDLATISIKNNGEITSDILDTYLSDEENYETLNGNIISYNPYGEDFDIEYKYPKNSENKYDFTISANAKQIGKIQAHKQSNNGEYGLVYLPENYDEIRKYIGVEEGIEVKYSENPIQIWHYNITNNDNNEITITGYNEECRLGTKNIIIPKYLYNKDGTKYTVTKIGNTTNRIADFSGKLTTPKDAYINSYAFYDCPNISEIVIGDGNTLHASRSAVQFTEASLNLNKIKIGNRCNIERYSFWKLPNVITELKVENETTFGPDNFESVKLDNIILGNNVTMTNRTFWGTSDYEIKSIIIGDNFTSTGLWLVSYVVDSIVLGENGSLADNGLSSQYSITIKEVTLNGELKALGDFSFYKCKINTPDGTLKIPDGMKIGNSSLNSITGITKIILGQNVICQYNNGYGCIGPKEDVELELTGPITLIGPVIGGKTRLPQSIEFTGNSDINKNFYYLNSGYNSNLKKLILNPGAKITSLVSYPTTMEKIVLKDITQWDSTLLESNKTIISNFGLTVFTEENGNLVCTK